MRNYALLVFLLLTCCRLSAQTLTINMSGIRSSEGTIRLSVFDTQQGFKNEKPILTKTIAKTGLANGKLTLEYRELKPGTYGIAILDDENNNQKMDYGLILPKEGFGFSDYYHTGMSRPVFSQFDFTIGREAKTVEIKLRYL